MRGIHPLRRRAAIFVCEIYYQLAPCLANCYNQMRFFTQNAYEVFVDRWGGGYSAPLCDPLGVKDLIGFKGPLRDREGEGK